jgi:hypothetical protein
MSDATKIEKQLYFRCFVYSVTILIIVYVFYEGCIYVNHTFDYSQVCESSTVHIPC